MKRVILLIVAAACIVIFLIVFALTRRREPYKNVPAIMPDALTPAQCDRIIERAKQEGLDRSTVLSDKKKVQSSRTSTNTFLPNDDPAVEPLIALVERKTGIPRSHYEDLQVVHYEPGQEYKAHYDACFKCDEGGKDVLRTHTALVFLNDVEEGGNTAFPKIGLDVPPTKGTLITWRNMDGRKILDESLHAGTPVVRGEKWACQVWIRNRPYRT